MKHSISVVLCVVLFACVSSGALGQSNISPAHKFCWSENCGFINWRDGGSPSGAQGVRLHATFLSGFAWGENIGWINFGDGTPSDDCDGSPCYSTSNGAETGVNRDASTGNLSGFAWGENVGWINFGGGALATPPNAARFDAAAHRLRGYAWGENIGWVNLDDANVFVGTCPADYNGDGALTVQDIFDFLAGWFSGNPAADFNGAGGLGVSDIFDFLAAWFAGC